MSLLLQALQKAAKNREAGTAPVEEPPPAAPPTLEPPAAILSPAFAVEAKQPKLAPETELALAEEDLFEADEPLPTEPGQRFEPFGASPSPSPANAASILRASETPSAGWIDFLRDRPVWALGIGAGVFLVFYGAYVYLQIAHPGILRGEFMRQPMAPKVPPPAALTVAPGPKPVVAPRDPLAPSGTPKPSVAATASQSAAVGTPATPQPMPSTQAVPGANPTPATVASPSQVAPAIVEPRTSTAHPSATVRSPQRAEATAKPTQATAAVTPRIRTTADPDETTANPEQAVRPALGPGKRRTRKESAAPVMSVPTLEHEISSKPSEPGPGTVAPVIKDAYLALQEGRLDRAETLYRNALQSEGQNVDALLGLAAIAAQRREVQQAIGFYERILDAEPRNATAQAGLIALIGQADPQMSETRLKQLIAREPSAFLYYSLGNLHANQNQWPAAQQAYFQAFQMQSDNPDYAYNLAVGLEHLNQSKLALTYYRKAIDLSFQKGRANFDQKRVIERIGQLSARFD